MNTLTLKVDTSSHEPVLQLAGANDDHILQQVRLTPEHPVYVLDRNGEELGWTITADLAPGDLIADIDARQAVKVVANKYEQLTTKVYNFEVEHAHNYFADELGLWVHNERPPASFWKSIFFDPKTPKRIRGEIFAQLRRGVTFSKLNNPKGCDVGHHPTNRGRHDSRSRLETIKDNRGRPSKTGNNPLWR